MLTQPSVHGTRPYKYQKENTHLRKIYKLMMQSLTLIVTSSPVLVLTLGVLIIFTLAYISIAQTRHIEQLGETISNLCLDSPFNNPDEADRFSENGEHFT